MSMLRKMLESDSALDVYQQYRDHNNKKEKTDQPNESVPVPLFSCIEELLNETLSASTIAHQGHLFLNIEKKTKDIQPEWGWYNSRKLVVSETGACKLFVLHEVNNVYNVWKDDVLDAETVGKLLTKLGDEYTWCRGIEPERVDAVKICQKEFLMRTVPYPHVTSVVCSRLIVPNSSARAMRCVNCSKLCYYLSRRRKAEDAPLNSDQAAKCEFRFTPENQKKSKLCLKKRNASITKQKVQTAVDGLVSSLCCENTVEMQKITGIISDNSNDDLKQLFNNTPLQLWSGESESGESSLEDMSVEDEVISIVV